jgi:hypothetical protein
MPMIQCPECQQTVSDLAPNCPNCGAPIAARPQVYPPPSPAAPPPAQAPAKKAGCVKMGCAILGGLFLLGLVASLVMNGGKSTRSAATSTSTASTTTPAAGTSSEPAAPESQWSYTHTDDAMAKGTVHEASVKSSNTVEFRFPYAGPQHGTLTLQTHPRYGKNVIFNIEKGQIPCPSYQGCKVLIRFDDSAPVHYAAVGPEDNSTETVFIRDYTQFLAKMQKAKTVRISANIYQEGEPVFEFDVRGFDPSQYKPKK